MGEGDQAGRHAVALTARRAFLAAASALSASVALRPFSAIGAGRPLIYADMHSHIGILGGRANIRDAMAQNGMLVVVRKIVADGPVIRRVPGKGIQQVRQPESGELATRFERALERIKLEHKSENLIEIVDAATLRRVVGGTTPAVVLAAEGADFIDGDMKRLEAARRQGLVHLQLVHYRVSDIGDISTEQPVHNGLTAFGKEVVAACNTLGILIDVAHCTAQGIAHALDISVKPIVYSHGQVISTTPHWTQSVARARAISAQQARRIAEKGGVIGLWPLSSQFRSLEAYAAGLLDIAQSFGAAHVGVGTDLFGLGGLTVIPGYEQFGQLHELLTKRGVSTEDAAKMLGGNYLRVLEQAMGS